MINNESYTPNYKREPILLSNHVVASIHLFQRYANFDDMWEIDAIEAQWDKGLGGPYEYHEQHIHAAKQFVKQLEGHWCVAFMEALKNEIDLELKKHKQEMENENKSGWFNRIQGSRKAI